MKLHLGTSGVLVRWGCVLLGRRVQDDDAFPGMWCTPGGGVEDGETLDAALKREFIEEVEIRIESTDHLSYVTQHVNVEKDRQTILVFKRVFQLDATAPIAGDGFDKVAWFDKDSVASIRSLITPNTYEALQHLFL